MCNANLWDTKFSYIKITLYLPQVSIQLTDDQQELTSYFKELLEVLETFWKHI